MTDALKNLHLQLRDELTNYYSGCGYLRKSDASAFEQQHTSGKITILFGPQAEHSTSIVYMPYVAITNHEVKSLHDTIMGSSIRSTMTATLGGESISTFMESYTDIDWKEYRLKTEADIADIVTHHRHFMETIGWPFIKRMDVRGISEWLNRDFFALPAMNDSEKIAMIRRTGAEHMTNGITAAWIANDPRMHQLIENYRNVFFPDHLALKIDQLWEGLKK